jgi:multidrug transporter EmrE-like cation transporter
MEGLTALATFIGMSVVIAVVFWILKKFNIPINDLTYSATGGVGYIVEFALDLIIKDESKKKKAKATAKLIVASVLMVEKSKTDIEIELAASGWDGKDRSILHAKYTEKAIEAAKELGAKFLPEVDGFSEQLATSFIEIVLNFLQPEDY